MDKDKNELEKIELTDHRASQVMKNFFDKGLLAKDNFEVIKNVRNNFRSFTDLLFQENQALSSPINQLISHDRQVYTHSVYVSLYSGILVSCPGNKVTYSVATVLKIKTKYR